MSGVSLLDSLELHHLIRHLVAALHAQAHHQQVGRAEFVREPIECGFVLLQSGERPAQRLLLLLPPNQPLVEVLQAKGIRAQRASPADVKAAADQALQSRFPDIKDLISHYDPPNFDLDEAVIEKHHLRLETVESTLVSGLMSTNLVEAVYTRAQLTSQKKSADPYLALYRNSFFAARSPHLLVRLKKYVYLNDRLGGTGHGSPYDYDRHIPIIFMGAGINTGRYAAACGPEDIAPTLALLLGIEYRKEPDSRLLPEMMRGPKSSRPSAAK